MRRGEHAPAALVHALAMQLRGVGRMQSCTAPGSRAGSRRVRPRRCDDTTRNRRRNRRPGRSAAPGRAAVGGASRASSGRSGSRHQAPADEGVGSGGGGSGRRRSRGASRFPRRRAARPGGCRERHLSRDARRQADVVVIVGDEVLPARGVETDVACRGDAEIAGVADEPDARIPEGVDRIRGAVGRRIVDDDEFEVLPGLRPQRAQRVADEFGRVEGAGHDAHARRGGDGHGTPEKGARAATRNASASARFVPRALERRHAA